MTLKNAIDRLYWRLKNGTWNPNQTDVDAVNELVTYVNNSKKQDIKENILFTKMYCYLFTILTDKYKDPNTAQQELHRILNTKTLNLYENYRSVLNTLEFEKFCNLLDIETDHLKPMSESYEAEQIKIISENKEQFLKHSKGLWEFEEIRIKLNDQISEAYNKFNQTK